MGMDFSSFTLGSDNNLFLKNVDTESSYAENQNISAKRAGGVHIFQEEDVVQPQCEGWKIHAHVV